MVMSDVSMLDAVPPLKGNPFDLRPIERSRAHQLVGRDEILTSWTEHMHSQSPRMLLLVGDNGSGRTSLINAISSQTIRHFVGQYWHTQDPLKRVLSEISVTFGGHEVPQTMHQTVERLVETLDADSGPLPLIALDYPSDVDFISFLTLISPILQRLRALVVVSLTNAQLSALEGPVRDVFEEPTHLQPLSGNHIQSLSDIRVRRMARQKWPIHPRLLESVRTRAGGNPRAVIGLLRDLIDEKRGLGCEGTLERLIGWEAPIESETQQPVVIETIDNHPIEFPEDSHLPIIEQTEENEDDWDTEPEDMWVEEEVEPKKETEIEIEQNENEDYLGSISDDQEVVDPTKITDSTPEEGDFLTMEKGTEPPARNRVPGSFSGLVSRSRDTSDQMPTGPSDSLVTKPLAPPNSPAPSEPSENPMEKPMEERTARKSVETFMPPLDEMQVFSSNGELWTVDSEQEKTLPEPTDDPIEDHALEEIEQEFEELPVNEQLVSETAPHAPETFDFSPKWKSTDSIDEAHLGSLNNAERLVVSIAGQREISPSDAVIQARLEVGRPRLSQIYNALHRSGILSVRKEGRSRLFKLSELASELLS